MSIVGFKAKVIQEFGLQVPSFVECGVVSGFYNARGGVQIVDFLVSSGEPKEDAGEVMVVELAPAMACSFDTYVRAESFEV